jgi:hypothetical protein
MNSTNENVVEITEEPKVKFRLFNNLEYDWVQVPKEWGDAEFLIRPMKHSERTRFANSETIISQCRDIQGAIEKSGVDRELLHSSSDDPKVKLEQAILSAKVYEYVTVDKDAEEEHQEEVKRVMLACIKTVKVGGVESEFTSDVYESIDADALRMWLMGSIKEASTLRIDERSGL